VNPFIQIQLDSYIQ